MRRFITLASMLIGIGLFSPANADNPNEQRDLVNQGTVAVLGGSLTGTYSRLVTDMSNIFDDGYDLRVIPIIGKGSLRGIEDLLYLRGIDVALVQSDVLDFITTHEIYPNIRSLIRYITILYNEEMHLVARKGIDTIYDLKGKKVSFGPISSGGFMTASIVFDRLDLDIEVVELSHREGLKALREGEIDAMVRVAGAPVQFFSEVSWEDQLHLVEVPLVEGAYSEATLTAEQYPGLIALGDDVKTIAVSAVMAAYNWQKGHPRRAKVQRLVDALYNRLPELQKEPFHPKWRKVDLGKSLEGWTRWDDVPDVPQS